MRSGSVWITPRSSGVRCQGSCIAAGRGVSSRTDSTSARPSGWTNAAVNTCRRLGLGLANCAGLAVTVVICVILVRRIDVSLVLVSLITTDHLQMAAAVGLCLLYLLARGLRGWWFLRMGGCALPWTSSSSISTLAMMASGVYPGLGEATRLMLLRRRSLSAATSASMVVQERLVDVTVLALLLFLGLALDPRLAPVGIGGDVALASFVLGASLLAVLVWAAHRRQAISFGDELAAGRLGTGRQLLGRAGAFIREVTDARRAIRHRPLLWLQVASVTIGIQILGIGVAWLSFLAVGVAVPPVAALAVVAAVNIGLGLVPVPMGLGLFQAAALTVLSAFSVAAESAVAAGTALQVVSYGTLVIAAVPSAFLEFRDRPADGQARVSRSDS